MMIASISSMTCTNAVGLRILQTRCASNKEMNTALSWEVLILYLSHPVMISVMGLLKQPVQLNAHEHATV